MRSTIRSDRPFVRAALALGLVTTGAATAAVAQVKLSEQSTVSQIVDGTVVTITYSRPQLRGRQTGIDGVYHYETMWTPGANWATTLEVSRAIKLNGHDVPAGKYSVWTETTEKDWTVYLHPEPKLWHTARPKREDMKLSFSVTPEHVDQTVEVLTFDFPEVRRDGMTLRFQWAKVVIPFRIDVQPTRGGVAMTEHQAAPYVGSWMVKLPAEIDSSGAELKMEVMVANGALRGVTEGAEPFVLDFTPLPDGRFILALQRAGRTIDVGRAPVVFEMENGRAMRWSLMRDHGSSPWISASRP